MIEFVDLGNRVRLYQKELDAAERRSEIRNRPLKPARTDTAGHTEAGSARTEERTPAPRVDEFSAVINFEYVPSGRILMNQEAREHIVDFFQ